MDMNDNDNLLIQSFFDQHRQEPLPDNGFSERVMQQIPQYRTPRTVIRSRVWTVFCCCVAVILFVFFGGIDLLKADVMHLLYGLAVYLFRLAARPGVVALIYLGSLVLTAVGIYNFVTSEYRYSKGKKEKMEHARLG